MSDQEFRLTDESALDIFGMGYLTVFELDDRMINLNAAIRVWRTWLAERDARIESAAEQRGLERGWRECAYWHAENGKPISGSATEHNPYRADQMEGDE